MHHLKVRSLAGLATQEQFTAFAANLDRLAAAWLHETCPDAPPLFAHPHVSVKQMVRIGANTSAWVIWQPGGCLLKSTELSVFAGAQLVIRDSAPSNWPCRCSEVAFSRRYERFRHWLHKRYAGCPIL